MSGGEIIIILLAVLLLFGADKIPEMVKGFAKGMSEFRKVSGDLKREFDESTQDIRKDFYDVTADVKKSAEEANQNVRSYIDESEAAQEIKDIDKDLKG